MKRDPARVWAWVWMVMSALSLGVASCVAISWGSAAWVYDNVPVGKNTVILGDVKGCLSLVTAGSMRTDVWTIWQTKEVAKAYTGVPYYTAGRPDADSAVPAWSAAWDASPGPRKVDPGSSGGGAATVPLVEIATGWPLRAMRYDAEATPYSGKSMLAAPIFTTSRAFPLREGNWSGRIHPRALPLGVIPLGFASDAGAFGVVWLGVLLAVKRVMRVRPAWQCAKCGYDLRGSAGEMCPECGTAHMAKGGNG